MKLNFGVWHKCRAFVSGGVWDVDPGPAFSLRGFGIRALRVIQLAVGGFFEDECPLHASALTFNTLMAIVPVLALSLALARGLGGADLAKERIRAGVAEWTEQVRHPPTPVLPGKLLRTAPASPATIPAASAAAQPVGSEQLADEIEKLVERMFEKVENISFAGLGGVSLVMLVWMVISVLGNVEFSFNRVWAVTEGRPLWRKFTDYVSVLVILPVLVVAASSLPAMEVVSRVVDSGSAGRVREFLGPGGLRDAAVLFFSTAAFTFLLKFMPNTRVRIPPAIMGGFLTALLFLLWLWVCALLQVGVARSGKIYGSFAVIPILLAWVYVSWEIILLGSEVTFAIQNCATYAMKQKVGKASVESGILLALAVTVEAARSLSADGSRFQARAFAASRKIPLRCLNDVLDRLVGSGLLVAVAGREGEYVLAKAPSAVRVVDLAAMFVKSGVGPGTLGLLQIEAGLQAAVSGYLRGDDSTAAHATIESLARKSCA